jgi:hypothetical protein
MKHFIIDVVDEEAKTKKKKKRPRKKKEVWPTMQKVQVQSGTKSQSLYGRAPSSSTQTSPTPSVHAPSTIDVSTFAGSALSLPLAQPAPATAQSARAYIASEGLDVDPKGKIKTRGGHVASVAAEQQKEKKKGFFSQFTHRNKDKYNVKAEEGGAEMEKKTGAFRSGVKPKLHLPHKAASLIGRVLGGKADEKKGQAGMKWEHFVKVRLFGSRVAFTPDVNNSRR